MPASAGAAGSALKWSAPRLIDRIPPFTSGSQLAGISCPWTTLCVATNVAGDAVVSTNPGSGTAFSWKPHHVDGVARIEAVSCPTKSLCVAVDQAGGLVASRSPMTARPWKRMVVDRHHGLYSVSCPSTSLCVAGDDSGNVVVSTSPLGGPHAWKLVHIHAKPNDEGVVVSCATSKLCVVTENQGPSASAKEHYDIVTSTNPTGGAAAWHSVSGPGKEHIFALTCLPSGLCLGAGDGQDVVSSTNPTGGTGAWTSSKGIDANVSSIACASPALCVIGDDDGDVASSTTPTSGGWTSVNIDNTPDGTGRIIIGIACPSASLCVGGDEFGNIVLSSKPTGDASAWKVFVVDGGSGLYEVSCPTASRCVARDTAGKVLTSTNPSGGAAAWNAVPGLAVAPNLTSFEAQTLFDLSCPSVSLCVTTDGARIFASNNPLGGAAAWKATGQIADEMDTLTCASPKLCVAIQGHIKHGFVSAITSTGPAGGAAAWKVTAPTITPDELINDISCPSVTLCVGTSGSALISTNPTGGNGAWHERPILPSEVDVVSCPSTRLCLGVDVDGRPVFTKTPAGRSRWRETKLPRSESLSYVTCASNTLCVGLSGTTILTTTNPTGGAKAWHATHIRGTTGTSFVAAVCASRSYCVAVSDDGYVVVGRRQGH